VGEITEEFVQWSLVELDAAVNLCGISVNTPKKRSYNKQMREESDHESK